MRYEIKGEPLPVLLVHLEAGEKINCQKGAMSWMTPNMKMETHTGGIGKMFTKAFSGESIFTNTYFAEGGPGLLAMASSFPGSLIPFDTTGLDFVMTAMFVVIFLEQWMKEKKHYTSLIGLFASVICLLIFGSDSFMIPTMLLILFLLTALRKPIEKGGGLE